MKSLNWPALKKVVRYERLGDGMYQEILECGHKGTKTKFNHVVNQYQRCWECHLKGK